MLVTAKQYGAGAQNFRMILLRESYGQQKILNECNHPPIPMLAYSDHFTVKSGEQFHLSAAGTTDPDGDSMSLLMVSISGSGKRIRHCKFQTLFTKSL